MGDKRPRRETSIPKYFWLHWQLIFLCSGYAWELTKLCGSNKVSVPSVCSPVLTSVSPDTTVRIKKSLRSWHKPVNPLSLPLAQIRNPGMATELLGHFSHKQLIQGQLLDLHTGNWLLRQTNTIRQVLICCFFQNKSFDTSVSGK